MPRCFNENKSLRLVGSNQQHDSNNILLTRSRPFSIGGGEQLDVDESPAERSHRRVRCDLSPVPTNPNSGFIKLIGIKVSLKVSNFILLFQRQYLSNTTVGYYFEVEISFTVDLESGTRLWYPWEFFKVFTVYKLKMLFNHSTVNNLNKYFISPVCVNLIIIFLIWTYLYFWAIENTNMIFKYFWFFFRW